MKQFYTTILAVLLLLAYSQATKAYDFSEENDFGTTLYYEIMPDSSCAVVSGIAPYGGSIIIPASVSFNGKEYAVSTIGGDAFMGCDELTAIKLPDGLTTIGSFAFSCCSKLTEITIPDGVTSIGMYAFSGCHGLTEINLPGNLGRIDDFAFFGCKNLSALNIPAGMEVMGHNALFDTPWWEEQAEGLVYYGDILLGYKGEQPATAEIAEGTRLIANGAFYNCTALTWVDFPATVNAIGASAFIGCSGLTSVKLPAGLKSIAEYAFHGCTALTSIEMPESLSEIGWYAFAKCNNLAFITIPENVSAIGSEAFRGCLNISKIICDRKTPPACYENAFNGISRSDCTLFVPEEAKEAYMAEKPWNEFLMLMPSEASMKDKCEAPAISVKDGKLSIESDTEGADCHYTISSGDMQSNDLSLGSTVDLSGQYTVTAYAKASGKLNSDIVTAILVWVNPQIQGDNIINLEAKKPVVLRFDGQRVIISGTDAGESIALYSAGGMKLHAQGAEQGETIIPVNLQKGQVYIVTYADKTIKFAF